MTTPAKSLKAQNVTWLSGVVAVDALALLGLLYPTMFSQETLSLPSALRMAFVAISPVAILLLSSLLPSEAKAILVFWRLRDTLPGHRAFSLHAARDPRIDIRSLRRNIGDFPDTPRGQNVLWYKLYKTVENETPIALAHRYYLCFVI